MPTSQCCYMCELEGTTTEHVPPKCLFPTQKDVGKDYRINLITVPSCDLHNLAKSKDDEFLMVSLAGILGNNSIGYTHRFTKIDRAIKRSSNRIIDKVITSKKKELTININENKFINVIYGTPDVERLLACFNHIARGIHFHHFGHPFKGQIKIIPGYLFYEEQQTKTWIDFLTHRSEIDLKDQPKIGENPEVFFYQISDFDEHGLYMMKMAFYGGINVYAAFIHQEATPPNNLAFQFLKSGIHTILTLNGTQYEFNRKTNGT